MRAKVTFGSGVSRGIHVYGIVGACLHACLATDASVMVNVHDAVRPLKHCADGADMNAWRICAMIAAKDGEMTPYVRERSHLDILDPGAIDAQRDIVLGLARCATSVATDTPRLVDHPGVVHGCGYWR